MRIKSITAAARFKDEIGEIIRRNLGNFRRNWTSYFVKCDMYRAYKDALYLGMWKRDGLAACKKIAKKYHLFSGEKLWRQIIVDPIIPAMSAFMALDFGTTADHVDIDDRFSARYRF